MQLQGYRPDNPAERLRTLRTSGDYSPTRSLIAEQARALLAAPSADDLPNLRDRALLALMLWHGLLAAEVGGRYPRQSFRKLNHYVRFRFAVHLRRRSQRRFRGMQEGTLCAYLQAQGLVYL
ncbi:MAG: hypothetical protein ABSD48_12575 [Armatimonadota bacterium]